MTVQSSDEQVQSSTTEPASSSTDEEINFHTIEEYRQALQMFEPPVEKPDTPLANDDEFTHSSDPLVDEFFLFISRTGRPHLPWQLIRPAFIWKLKTIMDDMHIIEAEGQKDDHLKEALINSAELNESKKFIMDKVNEFEGTPFTIQRLCELITQPMKHYHKTGAFLRAIEKNINVVTTITEEGLRTTGIDENIEVEEEEEAPIPVERNFIVSVDELDESLPEKINKMQHENMKEADQELPQESAEAQQMKEEIQQENKELEMEQ